jgi:hypothetical protein
MGGRMLIGGGRVNCNAAFLADLICHASAHLLVSQQMKSRCVLLVVASVAFAGCVTRRPEPASQPGFIPVQERPGLGTSWGEQRDSWVEPFAFTRTTAGRPTAEARIYYNDREGVDAMLDFLGGESKRCDGLQPLANGRLRVGVRDGSGRWVECHESRGRRLAVGDPGQRYEIVLKNEARRPVEVVVSVDGLDVMDGKPASPKKRGYVIAPFQTLSVDGFRTGTASIAAFHFGSMSDSYGRRRHGNATNAGVIGVALFEASRRSAPTDSPTADSHAWRFTGARPSPSRIEFAAPPEA